MHSDRRLACIRWRGKAKVVDKQGFHGPMDSRLFHAVRPECATKTRLRPVPKLIPSKAVYKRLVSHTLIAGLRAYGGVGRRKSLKSRAFTDPWLPAHFGQFACGAHPGQTNTVSEVDSIQGNVLALGLAHSDRRVACIRWRGRLKSFKRMAVTDPLIPGHFSQVSLGAQPRPD